MNKSTGIRLKSCDQGLLQEIIKRAQDKATILRATIVLLSGAGQSSDQISSTLGLSVRMVRDCRRRWRNCGVAGLNDAHRNGRPREADASYIRLMIRTVKKNPHNLGYLFARWTSPRLSTYLEEKTGVSISPKWIRELLKQHHGTWGKGKLTTRNLPNKMEKKISRKMVKKTSKSLSSEGCEI